MVDEIFRAIHSIGSDETEQKIEKNINDDEPENTQIINENKGDSKSAHPVQKENLQSVLNKSHVEVYRNNLIKTSLKQS